MSPSSSALSSSSSAPFKQGFLNAGKILIHKSLIDEGIAMIERGLGRNPYHAEGRKYLFDALKFYSDADIKETHMCVFE